MKKAITILWVALLCGFFSSLLAAAIKPQDYSFYMFLPATPDTTIGRTRLLVANCILVSGFVVALIASLTLAVRGLKHRRFIHLLWPLLVLANPLHQPVYLETLDSYLNYKWRDRAEQLGIVGKTPDEIRALFGKPSYQWTETPRVLDAKGNVTWQGEKYTGWDYHVIPLYWMGSKFQVFFVDGKVRNFEANDD